MGKMIVIEGLDGSGKSTQAELLKKWMEKEGYSTYTLDLPYYNDPSSTLVKMYLYRQENPCLHRQIQDHRMY